MTNKFRFNDIETLADIEKGLVKLKLDTRNLQDELQKANNCILKASHTDKVITKMAQFVIDSAVNAELIPHKELYKLRTDRKSTKKLVDEKGNLVLYKRGKHKGEQKYEPFTPAQYYSLPEIKSTGLREAVGEDTTKKQWKHTSQRIVNITTKTKHKYKGITAVETTQETIKGKKYSRTKTSGEGYVITGSRSIDNPFGKKRKRVYWEQVEGNPVYKKSFIKRGRAYYTDWEPHLDEVGLTHKIVIKNHLAGIRISVRKPKDDRFVVEGGKPYAFYQYYTEDAKWNRDNENASGRWLELAVGIPIEGNYKKSSIPEGDKNYETMIKILQDEIDATLEANGIVVKK